MKWTWNGGFSLRSSQDTEGDVQRVLGKLEATNQDQVILRLVANSPNVFRPFVLLANSLVNQASLPDLVRETVVLHLAVVHEASYEWESHQEPSSRAGITPEQREALRAGEARKRPDLFDEAQLLALGIADKLVAGQELTDEDWRAASDAWGREGALDLAFTVAWWGGFVPVVAHALSLRPEDGGR